jgi:hypothetical protein
VGHPVGASGWEEEEWIIPRLLLMMYRERTGGYGEDL